MRKTKFAYVLAFAPVLMGAGYYAAGESGDNSIGTVQSELIATTLPKCADDQYLSYSAGGLTCVAISGGTVTVPECNSSGQLLTFTSSGEFAKFSCTGKGQTALSSTDITLINSLYQSLVTLGTTLTNVEKSPRQSAAVFVGNTTAKVNGALQTVAGGTDPKGIPAAAALCDKAFPGSRMCTVYDIATSVTIGAAAIKQLNPAAPQKAWVYQASWNNSTAGEIMTSGVSDNCGGYTYPTNDKKWYGTAFTYEYVAGTTANPVPKFFGGSADARCDAMFPIACCK